MSSFDYSLLLRAFPDVLSKSEHMAMMASLVAEELQSLSEDDDLLRIYAQIDELDETMLDVLAYDFKIDWWDANATLAKKRETFKSHFQIHRTLGTIGSVRKALSEMYLSQVQEWPEYGGQPYHYKLDIDLGTGFGYDEILQNILTRARFYTNVRSVMEKLTFHSSRTDELLRGVALVYGSWTDCLLDDHNVVRSMIRGLTLVFSSLVSYAVGVPDTTEFIYLTDESGDVLTDEDGVYLIE